MKAWRDPHVAYAEETNKKGATRVRSLLPPEPILNPDAAAGFWREIAAALLLSGYGDASAFSSAAVAAARRFRPSDELTVFAVATHTRQAKVLHDRLDLWTLPPPGEQRDQTLTGELAWLADGLAKLPALALRDEFERRAERHFRALLARRGEGLPDWRAAILADLHAHPASSDARPGDSVPAHRQDDATRHQHLLSRAGGNAMNRIAAERFVRRLEKLGAAGRAALKGEAGRPPRANVPAFDAFTAAFWSLRDTRLAREACRLVAALYFWHPVPGGRGDIGAALGRLAGRGRVTGTERLLDQLLAAPLSRLHGPLFEAVRRLSAARVPVDWPQLILDLSRWDRLTTGEELSAQDAWANSWLSYGSEHAH